MSLFIGGIQVVGSGKTPTIGKNGNWFIGDYDTGTPTGTDIHYTTANAFKNQSDEGIYFVYEAPANIAIYHVDKNGTKRVVSDKNVIVPTRGENGNWFIGTTDTGIPVSGDGSTIAGAVIDDTTTDGTTTWSSAKVAKEILKIIKSNSGKALEFIWDGTKLGVRNQGDSVYVYSNLKGQKGDTGLDGASLVNARLNDNGELILEVPDDVDNEDLSRLLTFESGVITLNDMRTITDNITRLNNKVRELEETIEELKSSIVNR